MKILLVTLEYPPIIGGVSTYLDELYSNSPHEVKVISPATHQFYVWWCWPRWLPFYFDLKKMVAAERPDQIHVSHVLPVGVMAQWIFKSLKVPYVLYFHGVDLQRAHAQPRKWKRVERVVRSAARIIVNSDATAQLYKEYLPNAQEPHVVRPGAPQVAAQATGVSDALRDKYALHGTRVILFLARLIERKGLFIALDAMKELMRNNIEATLVVVGDGPERGRAEKYVQEHELYNRVRFIGRIPNEEKWQWYSIAHLFWFPAVPLKGDWEGFGITSLEAQAHGCPVVVSNVGGLPESVQDGETGIVTEPTAEAFAAATEHILNDATVWQQMRAAARQFAAQRTWNVSRAQIMEIIEN